MANNDAPRIALLMLGRLSIKDQDGNRQRIVIQRVGTKFGNGRKVNERYQLQVRRHVEHIRDAKTGPQLLRRARFTDAVTAWQGLTDAERADWKRVARRKHKIGYNLFISQYLRSGKTPTLPQD